MNMNLLGIFLGGAALVGCAAPAADAGPDATPPVAEDLIDDLEDGDDAINGANGRVGGWYTFNDATAGTQEPPTTGFVPSPGGAGGSAYAATTTGSGFTLWGAGMGFDLNNPAAAGGTGPRGKYDTSPYRGIAFKARGNVPIRVALETVGVTPTDRGGGCTPSMVMGMECDDLHGKAITLTADWQEHLIELGELRQGGWGLDVPFAATDVTAVLFTVDANLDFEVSVDDVRLYE